MIVHLYNSTKLYSCCKKVLNYFVSDQIIEILGKFTMVSQPIDFGWLASDQIFYFYFSKMEQNQVAICNQKLHHPIFIWPQICSYFL